MDSLAPGQVSRPGVSRDLPFHVSLGDSLASHPVARSLMSLLGIFSRRRINLEQSESLLLSPWIAGHHKELARRARAALALRERLPWEHTVRDLSRGLGKLDCPHLCGLLERALALRNSLPARAPLAHWSVAMTGLADAFGWPGDGEALDSDQFQAWKSVREQVLGLGALELVSGNTGFARAAGLLGQLLESRTFQPEAGEARVQVLDVQEASGLEFDHVWFADLVEERWPPVDVPDPFLPIPVQREAGCPGTDPGNRRTKGGDRSWAPRRVGRVPGAEPAGEGGRDPAHRQSPGRGLPAPGAGARGRPDAFQRARRPGHADRTRPR